MCKALDVSSDHHIQRGRGLTLSQMRRQQRRGRYEVDLRLKRKAYPDLDPGAVMHNVFVDEEAGDEVECCGFRETPWTYQFYVFGQSLSDAERACRNVYDRLGAKGGACLRVYLDDHSNRYQKVALPPST